MNIEFAKYYNVTSVLNSLLKKEGKLISYTKDYCEGVYICMDTHDFWVSRILKDMNEEYEEEKGTYLIERNKIDKYSLIDYMNDIDTSEEKWEATDRKELHYIFSNLPINELIKYVILYDDDQGLENWDNIECDSLEEAIETIDGGFGIIEIGA